MQPFNGEHLPTLSVFARMSPAKLKNDMAAAVSPTSSLSHSGWPQDQCSPQQGTYISLSLGSSVAAAFLCINSREAGSTGEARTTLCLLGRRQSGDGEGTMKD